MDQHEDKSYANKSDAPNYLVSEEGQKLLSIEVCDLKLVCLRRVPICHYFSVKFRVSAISKMKI